MPLPASPRFPPHALKDLFWLSFLLLIFYNFALGSYPLFTPDEGRYSAVARDMLLSHNFITPRLNGVPFLDKPILYYWLQAFAMTLFGVKEWALRFFPMLLGVLTTLSTYLCVRICFTRRCALLAAVMLATSPLYFCGAHYANLDLEVAAWISLSLLFFITGAQQTQSKLYFFITAYLCAALGFLTKGLIAPVFPTLIIGSWILLTNRWALLKKIYLPLGILLFFLVVTPWYWLAQKQNAEFLHYFFITQQFTRFLSKASFNSVVPFWFYVPIIGLGFFPWTLFLPQTIKLYWQNKNNSSLTYFFLWFCIVFLFFSIPHSKTIGYILPSLPPLAILVAYYLDQRFEEGRKRYFQIFSICMFLLAALFIYLTYQSYVTIPQGFILYLKISAFLFAISGISSLVLNHKSITSLISLLVLTNIIFLSVLTFSAKELNTTTIKPLLPALKLERSPNDEVINYYKFYQDLPLYLGERIVLVANWNSPEIIHRDNWVRELWFGFAMQTRNPLLIDETAFWQRWHSSKKLLVFLNANYLSQFQTHTKKYYNIAHYNDIILISNQRRRGVTHAI